METRDIFLQPVTNGYRVRLREQDSPRANFDESEWVFHELDDVIRFVAKYLGTAEEEQRINTLLDG